MPGQWQCNWGVSADAIGWSSRMQIGGQVGAITQLASIRHMLPDIQSEDSWLGENYRGWQSFANALKIASEDYDTEIVCRPEQGFLRVDCFFAPSHIKTLGYAVEAATSQICQRCGEYPAEKQVIDGWIWMLCHRCTRKGKLR